MKVLNVEQIRALDVYTIQKEPVASIDLMERASQAFVNWFVSLYNSQKSILIYCGTGNNGGDGLAIARLLFSQGYAVSICIIGNDAKGSADFKKNKKRLSSEVGVLVEPSDDSDIIIDAIFGSGLARPVEGEYAEAITKINQSNATKISIDIPSGLFADVHTESSNIVQADYTVAFQLPKLVFMFPDAHKYVGEWLVVDIGLDQSLIEQSETPFHFLTDADVRSILKTPSKFDHKGTNGHALLVTGSYGKIGASVLAGGACLRAGVGLLSIHIPKCGNDVLQSSLPEAMIIPDDENKHIIENKYSDHFSGLGIGPGLGQDKQTVFALEKLLQQSSKPLVLDADALNIIAADRTFLELIPANSILTPHPKEFQRLIGREWNDDFERLSLQRHWAKELDVIIVLKGAHTSIALPNGEVYFNSTGNTGMAKGGSGDVLLGIITSLVAQSYSPSHAAILGVYLHGLAGDIAAEQVGVIPMIASDLVNFIPEAYACLLSNC